MLTNRKPAERRGKVVLVDARESFTKMRKSLGDKRKYVTDDQITEITRLYDDALALDGTDKRVKVFDRETFGYQRITVERPLRRRWELTTEAVDALVHEKAWSAWLIPPKGTADAIGYVHSVEQSQERLIEVLQGLVGQVEVSEPAFTKRLESALADLSVPAAGATPGRLKDGTTLPNLHVLGKFANSETWMIYEGSGGSRLLVGQWEDGSWGVTDTDENELHLDRSRDGVLRWLDAWMGEPTRLIGIAEEFPGYATVRAVDGRKFYVHVNAETYVAVDENDHEVAESSTRSGLMKALGQFVVESLLSGSSTMTIPSRLRQAILRAAAISDVEAPVIVDRTGSPLPDADLRDSENVPLPVGYLDLQASSQAKVLVDQAEQYLANEIQPYAADAWIDHSKTKVGYEIPMTRHFHEYVPPRPLAEIDADLAETGRRMQVLLTGLERR